ncbi:phosphatase PAP2 family protein [Planctomycetota bacterium]
MNEPCATVNIYNTLRRVLRAHAALLVIVIMYVGACVVLTRIYKVETHLIYQSYEWFICITVYYLIIYPIHVMVVLHPDRPLTYVWDHVRHITVERLVSFVLVVAFVSTHVAAFMYVKPLIPVLHPFAWDATFARWDIALHGTDAWRLVHPYLSHPLITRVLVKAYITYFFVVFPIVPWQAARRNDSIVRMQFLLTFVLCWVLLGTVAATIFSSAGPCFYHHIVPGSDKYAELMVYLQSPATPASVIVQSQKNLWYFYENHEYGRLFAISAMPSMHVALTFLLVLVSRRRITRVLSIIFTIIVALGCIHFAWHYAVDVYAGIIGAWLIWWIVGLCLRGRLPFSGWRTQDAIRG